VNELLEARDDKSLPRVVARYGRVELLILDELAYVPLSPAEAELLFQVLDERSEASSLVLTTNLPFGSRRSLIRLSARRKDSPPKTHEYSDEQHSCDSDDPPATSAPRMRIG
jgi:DNA replication protein DnaC